MNQEQVDVLYKMDFSFELSNYSSPEYFDILSKDFAKKNCDSDIDPNKNSTIENGNLEKYRMTEVGENLLSYVQKGDFLHPVVDRPAIMGRMAFINTFSHFNALGLTRCDTATLNIWECIRMNAQDGTTIIKLALNGFEAVAAESGCAAINLKTFPNINFGLCGSASIILQAGELIDPGNAEAGDVIVLTKPLGTSVAVFAYKSLQNPESAEKIRSILSEDNICSAYRIAMGKMSSTNRKAAAMMRKYDPHGAVYVGKKGILGHAEEWVAVQKRGVFFFIHNLPIISKMAALDKALKKRCRLLEGYSQEICGGLMICFKRSQAANFCKEFNSDGDHAWIVGTVYDGNREAKFIPKIRIIEAEELPKKDPNHP